MRAVDVNDDYVVGSNGLEHITIKELELANDSVGDAKTLDAVEANGVLKVLSNEWFNKLLRQFYESNVRRERGL